MDDTIGFDESGMFKAACKQYCYGNEYQDK